MGTWEWTGVGEGMGRRTALEMYHLSAFESLKGKLSPLLSCGREVRHHEQILSPKGIVLNAQGGALGDGWFSHRFPHCRRSLGMDWILNPLALFTDMQTLTATKALGRAPSSFSSSTSHKTKTNHVQGWEVTCPKSHGRLAEDPELAPGHSPRLCDLSVLYVERILSKGPNGPVR